MDPSAILTALAELAPAGPGRVLDVTGGRALLWLPDPGRPPRTQATERLAAMDVLHRDERVLRRGWAFLVGTVEVDGVRRKVRLPLLSEPVRLRRSLRGYGVVAAGDRELTPLVEDHELAASLESAQGVGTATWLTDPATEQWIRLAAGAAGLPVSEVCGADRRPPKPPENWLIAIAHSAIYVTRDGFSGSLRDTLVNWARRPGLDGTALAAVYGQAGEDDTRDDGEVRSPLPLTVAQREVVRRARRDRVTLVSGPPGNGKSHAVVAAALDVGRFYDGRISIATRHPRNDSLDVIDVIRVSDKGVARGVTVAEVDAVVAAVRRLAAAGEVTSVAVVTPFRAQADALESALVGAFSVAELERLGLRVGTVHAFQGSEAHTVVASLGLVDGDSPSRTRFVADPHLFNVLATRARERMIVVTSLAVSDGVVGDYLAFSTAGPRPPTAVEPAAGWVGALAAELRRSGLVVRPSYPVGKWTVDVCVGQGADAVGLICTVHPDGVAAHLQRQRSLTRAGWRLIDAYASRWAGDPVRAALALAVDLRGH